LALKELTYLLQVWCHENVNTSINSAVAPANSEARTTAITVWWIKVRKQERMNIGELATSQTHILVRSKRHERRLVKNSQTTHCKRLP